MDNERNDRSLMVRIYYMYLNFNINKNESIEKTSRLRTHCEG